jgi:hypothetical protein
MKMKQRARTPRQHPSANKITARTARRSRGLGNSFALAVFRRVAFTLPPADPATFAPESS